MIKTANTTDGGLSIHITNDFLSTIKNQVIDALIESIKPDNYAYDGSKDLSLFKFNYYAHNVTMNAFDMNYTASGIQFYADAPNIRIKLVDFQMDLVFNYNLSADPMFYLDEGPGQISFKFSDLSIGLGMDIQDGIFQFTVSNVSATFDDAVTYFNGNGDISYLLNTASSALTKALVNDATSTISMIVGQAIPLINSQLMNIGCTKELDGLIIDWTAMEQPKFDDDSLSLIFKGETRYSDQAIPFESERKIPYSFKAGKDLQLMVSDYFLNSTIYSAYHLGLLEYEISKLSNTTYITASMFKLIWPDIVKEMDPTQKLSIGIKASPEGSPYIEIANEKTNAYGLADLSFSKLYEDGSTEVFLEFTSSFTAIVDLEIESSPFQMLTDIEQLKLKASSITTDKYGLTNLDDLNSMVGLITGFLRNYANEALSGTIPSTINLGVVTLDYSDTQLFEQDSYIYLNSKPQFATNVGYRKEDREPVMEIKQKPVTHEEQVNALAGLLKLTPIYQSLLELKKNEVFYKNLQFVNPAGPAVFGQHIHESEELPKERIYTNEEVA